MKNKIGVGTIGGCPPSSLKTPFWGGHLPNKPVNAWKRGPDVEIVADPGILVPRKYLIWQKIFGKMLALNCKIDFNVRKKESIEYFL